MTRNKEPTSTSPSTPGLDAWITQLLEDDQMLRMGHAQRREDWNLGMGWLYYGLTRLIRPAQVVVIGSWRGFAPLIFARALADNCEDGTVTFIDPSLVDDHWTDPESVQQWFHRFGVENIDHHQMTTQQFIETDQYRRLDEIGILFIDGHHTHEQARIDYDAFADRVPADGVILLHDSVLTQLSTIHGEDQPYRRTVRLFVDQLKQDSALQVLDIPFCHGLTIVRHSSHPSES